MTQAQAFNEFAAQAFYAEQESLQARNKSVGYVCIQRILRTIAWSYDEVYAGTAVYDFRDLAAPGTIDPAPPDQGGPYWSTLWRVIPVAWQNMTFNLTPGPPPQNWSFDFGPVDIDGSLRFLYLYERHLSPGQSLTVDLQIGCADPEDPRFINWPGSVMTRTQWY